MNAKEITRVALLGAFLYIVYFLGSTVEYIELVSFMILVYGTTIKTKIAYFSAVLFSLLVMVTNGVNLWTMMYLIIFPQYILIYSGISKLTKNRIIYLVLAAFLSFWLGTLIEIPYIIIVGYHGKMLIRYLLLGFMVSGGNMACTVVAGIFLYDPFSKLIRKTLGFEMVKEK